MPSSKSLNHAPTTAIAADFHGDLRKGAYLQRRASYRSQGGAGISGASLTTGTASGQSIKSR